MQSSLAGPVMDGSSPLASTSSAASDATATAAASRSERVRQRAENAKKKMQRVVHERAPGISTLVAGHEDTKYSLHNKIYTYAPLRSSSNHANGYSSSSPSLHLAPPGSSGLGPSSHRRHPKRYSAQEVQRLVPDELGELHDPEYERIRMVSPIAMDKERRRRRRRKLKAQQKDNPAGLGTVQGADGDGNSIASGSIASSSAASSSSDSSSSAGSSDDDEDPEGSEVSSTMSKLPSGAVRRTAQLGGGFSSATSTTMSITSAAHPTATSSLSTSSPYRYVPSYERYRNASLNTLAPSQPKTLQGFTTSLAAHHKSSQQQARIMRQLQREQERMEAGSNSNSDSRSDRLHPDTTATSSIYNRSSFSTLRPPSIITTTHSSEYSGDQASSRRSTARTYADAGVTYLAPSITMPPVAPSGRSSYTGSGGVSTSGTYNPYTYIPTTAAASHNYSSSVPKHPAYAPSPLAHQRKHVAFATEGGTTPSNAYTTPVYESIASAPPIAWSSSFTPSSEHPERHKSKQHSTTTSASNASKDALDASLSKVQHGFQKLKLDVSFGLLKLRK